MLINSCPLRNLISNSPGSIRQFKFTAMENLITNMVKPLSDFEKEKIAAEAKGLITSDT